MGRSSGGITGTASRIIHSGLFSDLMNASTTFSRLMPRCCFCPFEVLITSRSVTDSSARSRSRRRSRIASAPMPPRKYCPKPYGEPKRSFSSRNSCSSLTTSLGSSSRNSFHVSSSRRTPSTAASRASLRRESMSCTISRTLSAHWRDDVEVVLLGARQQAEVVRELAHLVDRLADVLLPRARRRAGRYRPRAPCRRFLTSTFATISASSPGQLGAGS